LSKVLFLSGDRVRSRRREEEKMKRRWGDREPERRGDILENALISC